MSTTAERSHITAYIPRDDLESLLERARLNEWSLSAEIRLALRGYLERELFPAHSSRSVASRSEGGHSSAATPRRDDLHE